MDNKSADSREFIIGIMLCMLVMFGWMWYKAKTALPPETPTPPAKVEPVKAESPAAPASDRPEATLQTKDAAGWRLRSAQTASETILGSKDPKTGFKSEITIDGQTASVSQVLLSNYKFKVEDELTGYPLLTPATDEGQILHSLMLGKLQLAGKAQPFDLSSACWTRVESSGEKETTLAVYRAVIESDAGDILDVVKRFEYKPDNYELAVTFEFTNHTEGSLGLDSLELIAAVGALREDPRTDGRNMTAAFINAAGNIDTDRIPLGNVKQKYTLAPADLSDKKLKEYGVIPTPNDARRPAWLSLANKYFAAAIEPVADEKDALGFGLKQGRVYARKLTANFATQERIHPETLGVQANLTFAEPIAAGQTKTLAFRVYLGPIDKDIFDQPQYARLHYEKLLPNASCCSFCAFDWLTFFIVKVLNGMYNIFGNYGVAIIILVLLVRLLLHPITKKGQISMMKSAKLQPKIEELKKKYANNPQELQRKQMELQKEAMPAMMLGCLPMMIQMPLWIALYTAVNVNVAIRHHGLLPPSWHWLTDLSAPDRLIPFEWFGGDPVTLPLIGNMIGQIDAFNLLPILLAIAMFMQQKLTPSTAAATNPQAAQQQKMMLWMMPIMMVLFLYTAPSGLNLYIMASTFGGVIEQYVIRKHIRQRDAEEAQSTVAGTSKIAEKLGIKKKKPKPPIKFG